MAHKKEIAKVETATIQPVKQIESLIITIRGKQVILDRDLARLYGVDTKVLNQAVKRNVERFPEHFRYQLTENEAIELVTNCDRLQNLKHSSVLPYVFTEQGVAMLFGTQRPAITKHLNNIYNSGELARESTCSILERMGNDGKQRYQTKYYNLDAILSVGYRVNSKNATLFR